LILLLFTNVIYKNKCSIGGGMNIFTTAATATAALTTNNNNNKQTEDYIYMFSTSAMEKGEKSYP
jgi:hypothetical protein